MSDFYEKTMMAYQAVKKAGTGRALVFAPHPDDEVFGCGGAIIRHVQQQDTVKVVIVTDGDFPVNESQNYPGYAPARRQESIEAAKVLGYGKPQYLGYPDRSVEADERMITHFLEIITDFNPQCIYLPSDLEIHPDHLAVYHAVVKSVGRFPENPDLYFYEIGSPLEPNLLLDITDIQEQLEMAMNCFTSQLNVQDYRRHMQALHAYRTYTLGSGVEFAEAYLHLKSADIKPGDLGWQQNKCHFQHNTSFDKNTSDPPLISVIVRTMNRPQLPEALQSIAEQTYPKIEVIVVDARGEQPLNLGDHCGEFPLRTVSKNRSLSRPEAANSGLEAVQGQYFCFLDEDDILLPDSLEDLFKALSLEDAPAAYNIIERVDHNGQHELWFDHPYDFDKLIRDNYIPNLGVLFNRTLIDKGCRFDVNFEVYEDWDFLIQASQFGEFLFVNKRGGKYRNLGSSKIYRQPDEALQFRKKVIAKWLPRLSDGDFKKLIPFKNESQKQISLQSTDENIQHIKKLEEQLTTLQDRYHLLDIRYNREIVSAHQKSPGRYFRRWLKPGREKEAAKIRNCPLFDERYYLENNPDVILTNIDPAMHYLLYGGYEGRKPSADFDSAFYLLKNQDVFQNGINPLIHYLRHGWQEGRKPLPDTPKQKN